MKASPLRFFLSVPDRVLYRQYADLSLRNYPLLLTSNILLYLICCLMFADAVSWRAHLGFGIALLALAIITAFVIRPVAYHMKNSPEASIQWVLIAGLPVTLWWNVYFTVLSQNQNTIYIQQFIVVLSLFEFIAVATCGRFSRTLIFFLSIAIAHIIIKLMLMPIENRQFFILQVLLYTLAELVFLRTLNQQISKLLRFENQNNELLDALQQKNTALEQANVSQSRYLSAASHDLRQPLHALALLTNDAQRKNTQPEINSTLKKMELAIDSLSQSFNAMLNLSRLDAGVVRPLFKRFPIQRLFQRLNAEYADVATDKNLSFRIHPSNLWVLSDEDMLYSILSNFVSNALRYTQKGGVLIGTRRLNNGRFKLIVYDTGSGVPSEKAQQIFQEYQRLAEAEQRVKGGVGLGLAISERMAKLLGAHLLIKSALGQGSAFGLMLTQTEAAEAPPTHPPTLRDFLTHKRVAIFDDDEVALESLEALLSSWGMNVSIALSSSMLSEMLADEGNFDCVISDYHLGHTHETGLDVLRHAQRIQSTQPPICLMLTGDTRSDLAQEAEAAQIHLWYKPIRPARLRAYLNDLMQKSDADVSQPTIK